MISAVRVPALGGFGRVGRHVERDSDADEDPLPTRDTTAGRPHQEIHERRPRRDEEAQQYTLPSASVRTPQPEKSLSDEVPATLFALDLSTMPLHSRWPLFEARASICLPSLSRPSAKYSPSSTQKSRLKRRLRSAACRSSSSANAGSFQTSRARRAPRILRRRRSPGARRSHAGSPACGRRGRRSSPRSPSSTGSRGRFLVAPLVRDVTVVHQVGVVVDPASAALASRSNARTRRLSPVHRSYSSSSTT